MTTLITSQEGPLAIFADRDERTIVYSGENTFEARRLTERATALVNGAAQDVVEQRDTALTLIDTEGAARISLARAWAEGETPPDNGNAKSARTWAYQAAASSGTAEAFAGPSYATQAEGLAATVSGQHFAVVANGIVSIYLNSNQTAVFRRNAATSEALASGDADKGSALVGFRQSGTGSILRTGAEKFREKLTPEDFGALANGTSDTGSFLNAIRSARSGALNALALPLGKTYTLTQMTTQNMGGSEDLPASGQRACICVPPGMHLTGEGAILRTTASIPHVYAGGEVDFEAEVIAPIGLGSSTFTLGSDAAAAFAVGDTVLWRLGDVAGDPAETENWGFASVLARNLTSGTVTIDRALAKAWTMPGTDLYNKFLYKVTVARGRNFGNLVFDGSAAPEGVRGIKFYREIAPRLESLFARRCTAGGLVFQYTENFHVGMVHCFDNPGTSSNNGKAMRCAESSGYIAHLRGEYLGNSLISCEAGSSVAIGYAEDFNTGTRGEPIINSGQGCAIYIERMRFHGKGGVSTVSRTGSGILSFGSIDVAYDTDPVTLPLPGRDCMELTLTLGGTSEIYRAAKGYWSERLIYLQDDFANMSVTFDTPGVVTECWVYFGNCVAADFAAFRIGRSNSKSDAISFVPTTQRTYPVDCSNIYRAGLWWGANAGNMGWLNRGYAPAVQITAAAGRNLTGSGKFIKVRCYIIPDDNLVSTRVVGDRDVLQSVGQLGLSAAKSWSPGSLAAGASVVTTIAVSGAILGDPCTAAISTPLAGLALQSEVTANGTVTVKLTNPTLAAIDPGTVTLRAKAFRN
ncbi:hypothetical protein HT136_08390 [Novosphingobium profundi]|uniref:hypothetical protein n=1 Tax=Novosphingobium profundi TaxID=1774954 RepID=UPI001BDABA00|nr:hypothetical protein [Novosphingobium profundi]MBT0668386.1 hypothetical protein [Novosphingobium profundi]